MYKNFKRLPKRTIPINAPIPKGRRYKKFFLKSLKRFRECKYFEYKSLSIIEKVRNKFSYAKNEAKQAEISNKTDELSNCEEKKKVSIKAKMRNAVKKLYYNVFVSKCL